MGMSLAAHSLSDHIYHKWGDKVVWLNDNKFQFENVVKDEENQIR